MPFTIENLSLIITKVPIKYGLTVLKKKPVFYGVLQVVAVTLFGYYYVAAGCDMDRCV